MEKSNGVLAAALRDEINRQDLPIKIVADRIHRSETVVFTILRGEKVGKRTLTQLQIAFPQVFA